jgi:hypothetical protein
LLSCSRLNILKKITARSEIFFVAAFVRKSETAKGWWGEHGTRPSPRLSAEALAKAEAVSEISNFKFEILCPLRFLRETPSPIIALKTGVVTNLGFFQIHEKLPA